MRKKIILILVSLFMIISSTSYVSADDTDTTVNHGSLLDILVADDSERDLINNPFKTGETHKIVIEASNANANIKNSKKMRVYLHDPSGNPLTNVEVEGMENGIMHFPYSSLGIVEPLTLNDVVVKDPDGNVTERYLEFDIIAGASVEMELELFVPGGISGPTNLKLEPEIVNEDSNDKVGEGVDVFWDATFEWTNLQKDVDKSSISSEVEDVLNYSYSVKNKEGIVGNIWEKEIVFTDTLTFPEGLSLPEGYVKDVTNNKIKTADGLDIYTFDFDVTGFEVVVDNGITTIITTGKVENPHANNNILENDYNPLKSWHSSLHTQELVTSTTQTGSSQIKNHIDTVFVPCVPVNPIELQDDATTTIAAPEPADVDIFVSKYDSETYQYIKMFENDQTITYKFPGIKEGMKFKVPDGVEVTYDDVDGHPILKVPSTYTSNAIALEKSTDGTGIDISTLTINVPVLDIKGLTDTEAKQVKVIEVVPPNGYSVHANEIKPTKRWSGHYYADVYDDKIMPTPEENENENKIPFFKVTGYSKNKIVSASYSGGISTYGLRLNIYSGNNKIKFTSDGSGVYTYAGVFTSSEYGCSIDSSYKTDYELVFKNLPDGEYRISEYDSPWGYEKTNEDMYFEIKDGEFYRAKTSSDSEWVIIDHDLNGNPLQALALNNKKKKSKLTIYKTDNFGQSADVSSTNPVYYSITDYKDRPLLLKQTSYNEYHYAGIYQEDMFTGDTYTNVVVYPHAEYFKQPEYYMGISGLTYNPPKADDEQTSDFPRIVSVPCHVYFYASGLNRDQNPNTSPARLPYLLNYEINCYIDGEHGWTGWLDSHRTVMTKTGGEFEYYDYEITQDMLDANGGTIKVDISARATRYPNVPISALGQKILVGATFVCAGTDNTFVNGSNFAAESSTIYIYGLPANEAGKEYKLTEDTAPNGYIRSDETYYINSYEGVSNYIDVVNAKEGVEAFPDETNYYLYFGKTTNLDGNDYVSRDTYTNKKINPKGMELVVKDSNGHQLGFNDYIKTSYSSSEEVFEYDHTCLDEHAEHRVIISGDYTYLKFKNLPSPTGDATEATAYNEYTIQEVVAPYGYEINPEPLKIRIYKDYSKVTYVDSNGTESITFEKSQAYKNYYDATTTHGKQEEYLFSSKVLVINDEEADNPSNIYIEKQDLYGVAIKDDSTKFVLKNSDKTAILKFKEKDKPSLDGNEYIYDENGTHTILSVDVNGKLALENLPKGIYYLEEVEAPHGYGLLTDDIKITVDGVGEPISVVVQDPFYIFGAGRYASSSYKKIEEIGNEENIGYSFESTTSNAQGFKNNIVVDDRTKDVRFSLYVSNQSLSNFDKLVIIDKLPEPGDTGVVNLNESRGSEFTIRLLGNPNFKVWEIDQDGNETQLSNYVIEYSDKTSFKESDFNGDENDDWTSDAISCKSFRLKFNSGYQLYTKHSIRVEFDCKLMEDADPGEIAWNNFGYRYKVGSRTLTPEPLKVGVKIKSNNPGNPPTNTPPKYEAPNTKVN